MSHTPRTLYFVMAAWMLIGSAIRCQWLIAHGFGIDFLPVITITLAILALIFAFRSRRTAP